jgi:hypothetical protein
MFNLVGLPLTTEEEIKATTTVPVTELNNNNNTVPLVNVQSNTVETKVLQTTKEPYNTTTTLPGNSTGNEIVSFTINDPNLYQIEDIEIYGRKYKKTFEENLEEGMFRLDPVTNELKIYLRKQNNYSNSTSVKVNGTKKKLTTNEVPNVNEQTLVSNNLVPSFIKEFNLIGSISISRGFQDHPSCSFNLLADEESIEDIESLFNAHRYESLFKKKFVFYGIPFRIRSFTRTESKETESPNGEYKISVNFEGWYRYLIDKSVTIRPGTNIDPNAPNFTECNINANKKPTTTTIGSNTDVNKIRISLGELGSRSGITYTGSQHFFEVDKNTPNDAVTTFSSELNRLLPSFSEYAIYSLSNGVTTKKWNSVNNFQIDESDILSECGVNYNAEKVTYAPGTLSWKDNNRDNSTDSSEDTYNNKAPEFEYKPPQITVVVTGDPKPTEPPANVKIIQTLDMNYDQSGEKKVEITTTYEGTTVIKEVTKTYGLAYNANQIYSNNKLYGNAANYWVVVEEVTTNYLYDKDTGYYLGNNVTGKKLVRFIQETDELETVKFATSSDAVEIAKFAAMKFRYIPITGHTRYLLRQHKDYYKDQAFKHPYIIYPWCTNAGKLTYLTLKDPTYADDMFVGREETYKHCFASIPNPENLSNPEIKLPPLTTGEIYYNSVVTKICASKSVYESGTPSIIVDEIIGKDFDNPEERYITYTKQYSAQDTNFRNSLEDIRSETVSGRPGVAQRKPSDYIAVTDESQDPLQLNSLSGGSIITTKLRETKVNKRGSNNDLQYIAYTVPYTSTDPVTTSYSFEAANSFNTALEALTTQLNIQKTQQEATLNITTLFNIYLIEGYRYSFSYRNNSYLCRILSINHSLVIEGVNEFNELIVTGTTTVQLGIEGFGSLNYYTKRIKNNDNPDATDPNSNTVNIWNPHYVGKTLGTLIDIAATYGNSRGTFTI